MAWAARPAMPALHKISATDMAAILDEIERLGTKLWSRKTATQSVNNSSTFVNCTDLARAVLANTQYRVVCLVHQNSGTTPDIKFQWTTPALATLKWHQFGQVTTYQENYQSTAGVSVLDGIGADQGAMMVGMLFTGATAGSIQLQFAQITPTVSNTNVLVDSFLYLEQVS